MPNENENSNDWVQDYLRRNMPEEVREVWGEHVYPEPILPDPEPIDEVLRDSYVDINAAMFPHVDSSVQEVEDDEEVDDRSINEVLDEISSNIRDNQPDRLGRSEDVPYPPLRRHYPYPEDLNGLMFNPLGQPSPPSLTSTRARRQAERQARLNRTEASEWKQAARNVPEGGTPENLPTEDVVDFDFDIMKAVKEIFADKLDWDVRYPEKTCLKTWIAPKAVTFWRAFEAMGMLQDQDCFRPRFLRRMGRDLAATGVMVTVARENGKVRMFLHFPESQGQSCEGFHSIVDWALHYVNPSEVRWLEFDSSVSASALELSADASNGCDCPDCCDERTSRSSRRRHGQGFENITEPVNGYPAKRTLRITW